MANLGRGVGQAFSHYSQYLMDNNGLLNVTGPGAWPGTTERALRRTAKFVKDFLYVNGLGRGSIPGSKCRNYWPKIGHSMYDVIRLRSLYVVCRLILKLYGSMCRLF